MRKIRTIAAMCAVIAAVAFTAAACGSEDPAGTVAAPVTSAPSAAPVAPPAVDNPTDAVATPEVVTPAAQQPADPGLASIPPAPNRDDVNVDARDFEQAGGQFFFQSPSGNAFCGFNSANASGTVVGCQVRYSVPGNTGRKCANTANNTYGVQILQTGEVQQICTNQGIFVGEGSSVPVLEYGQVIGVTGNFCRSTEAGITCYDGDRGFMISRDVNLAF